MTGADRVTCARCGAPQPETYRFLVDFDTGRVVVLDDEDIVCAACSARGWGRP